MTVVAALLRGVNVGGHQKLPSAMLKKACEAAGGTAVRTYLQSGNAVFRTSDRSAERVAEKLESALHDVAGFSVDVIVRTFAELQEIIERNPFGSDADPRRLVVIFLGRAMAKPAFAALEKECAAGERIVNAGRELYAWFENGMGRSKLASCFTERKLGVTCTARNWNTVTALLRLAEEAQ